MKNQPITDSSQISVVHNISSGNLGCTSCTEWVYNGQIKFLGKKIEEIQITGVLYDPKPFGGPARITFWLVHVLFVVEISQRASPKRCYLTFLSGWYRSFINVFQKEDNCFSQVGKAISVEELNFFVSQKKFLLDGWPICPAPSP